MSCYNSSAGYKDQKQSQVKFKYQSFCLLFIWHAGMPKNFVNSAKHSELNKGICCYKQKVNDML